MDDPNMTMEGYIKLEEGKARMRGRVFKWKTATYGKIMIDDDLHDLSSVEAEFPAIIINDAFAPQDALQCKSQVSTPFNGGIDFRISFDESDDEDYIIICDKNSFSYKMIYVNNLKTDSEKDNEKVIPSIPSHEPAISCFDDLDFFKDFENEFSAIVYNDVQTSKSDLLNEPTLNLQHIDELNLNDETSMSEYDEEEQNILYFNDLFPFNVIYPNDSKSDKDNDDDDKVDIEHSSGDLSVEPLPDVINTDVGAYAHGSNKLLETRLLEITSMAVNDVINFPRWPSKRGGYVDEMVLPGLEYTDEDITDFEERMRMEHRDDADVVVFTSQAWGRLFGTRGPLVWELILEFLSTLRFGEVLLNLDAPGTIQEEMESPGFARCWSENERMIHGKGDLHDYWRDVSTDGDFLGPPPSYTLIRGLVLRLCHQMMAHNIAGRSQALEKMTVTDLFYLRRLDVGSVNIHYLLVRYLRRLATGRKSRDHISGGQFVARLAEHFGLLTAEILGGLTVITHELLIIDMTELRQPDVTVGALVVAEDAPAADEGDQAVLALVQAPQQPPPLPSTAARTVPQRLGRLEEDVQGLRRDLMDASGLTYQAFDGTFRGSSPAAFPRCTK
ncbi:hypothetical protein Tco_1320925 [Tanacetum coccineum]